MRACVICSANAPRCGICFDCMAYHPPGNCGRAGCPNPGVTTFRIRGRRYLSCVEHANELRPLAPGRALNEPFPSDRLDY